MISATLSWFLIGILFLLFEFAMPGFIVFFLGVGAWCTSLSVFIFDFQLSTQLIIFITSSIISLLLLRKYLRSTFSGDKNSISESDEIHQHFQTGIITEKIIPPAHGRVKYGGSYWNASSDKFVNTGQTVKILDKKDLFVKAEPIPTKGEDN